MWVEELTLENIKCFDKTTLKFGPKSAKTSWVTLLSENGNGKTTALQSLALLLAGPEAAAKLLPRPFGWLKNDRQLGKISVRIHKDPEDQGTFGAEKIRNAFGYSYHITGTSPTSIRNRRYAEPGIHQSPDKVLSWLRQNAFSPQSKGWFAVGYGAFRRLTRSHQVIVPTLDSPNRYSNFVTQFEEDEGLAAFERWMIYLDYRKAKLKDKKAAQQRDLGISAINELLPTGVRFDSIDGEGRIFFRVNQARVSTLSLSDGYRSVLALGGDLVWRMISAFPSASNPLHQPGVVLIDELDIHLHPVWQRFIASWLRAQFPNIQFIITTHSPLVAAGAGQDALTLKLDGRTGTAKAIGESLYAMDVDDILRSEAFAVVSTYTPETQAKLERLSELQARSEALGVKERRELTQLSKFVSENNPYGLDLLPSALERRVDAFLKRKTLR